MKIVFMGTPCFAASVLQCVLDSKAHEVAAVVTQPDKPQNRGKKVLSPPVKILAEANGIEVYQPERLKSDEAFEFLKAQGADVFVVAAYGQILSQRVLDLPRYGAINVHASLLPAYRGAAPIEWCVANGETETGITIMKMDRGLDTGDMLLKQVVPITPDDTGGSLTEKLQNVGGPLLLKALADIENIIPEKQDDGLSSYAPMLKKEMGRINWYKSAIAINDLVRAFDPAPSAFTEYNGDALKIWKTRNVSESYENDTSAPGCVIDIIMEGIVVKTGENGAVLVLEIQSPSKKRMPVPDFLRGYQIQIGCILAEGGQE